MRLAAPTLGRPGNGLQWTAVSPSCPNMWANSLLMSDCIWLEAFCQRSWSMRYKS